MHDDVKMKKVVLVLVSGKPRAGKDTAIAWLKEKLMRGEMGEHRVNCSSSTSVAQAKEALRALGWEGEKTPEVRKALSDLKLMGDRMFDTSFLNLRLYCLGLYARRQQGEPHPILFYQVRERDQILDFTKRHAGKVLHLNFQLPEGSVTEFGNMADDQDVSDIADVVIPYFDKEKQKEDYEATLTEVGKYLYNTAESAALDY